MSLEAFADEALLALVARGEEKALEVLLDRYGGVFLALARRLGLDESTAEDVVQEAFLRIWRGASSFDPRRASARAWLLSVAHHAAVDELRRRRARPEPLEPPEDEEEKAFDLPGPGPDEEARLDRVRLEGALRHLSEEERVVIHLLYFRGYTHEEAARRLGLPLGTLKTRARRALLRLKEVLREA
ncbi:DNA-directed RNA polymerase specialized sigma subunit, sigma24 (plasmid) [Thermus oshimai JL-2]|uniref:RNA polymerase sigma factor n=1 Tax=Thermus oshimai JL-2 TaxID=751945 RepID=K7QZ41_THEOS|nr:sigma-70 family RNA polymerase sigma factor [Thermus oshimai]AFV77358.1 DNA-directed RNA polymerase specialized sigma subunit, sigma24 [Thermus oshimai JL-2]